MKAVVCVARSPGTHPGGLPALAARPIGHVMSDSQAPRGAGPGPAWVQRTYAAVHAEAKRRVDAGRLTGAERWHMAEEGGYDETPPPEPLARGAASSGAGAELASALGRRGTCPLDLPAFDDTTEEGRKRNLMAERVKTAYLSLGLTLAHYSPTRHTVYVCGRPVQAGDVRGCPIRKSFTDSNIFFGGTCSAGCGADAQGRGHQRVQPHPCVALPAGAGHRGVQPHGGPGAGGSGEGGDMALVHGGSAGCARSVPLVLCTPAFVYII